jgi:hypothetical protein
MTLVFEKPQMEPATHALVIGIGAYVHLKGGKGTQSRKVAGMSQLTSPPCSARKFAEWLLKDFKNPEKPLASLDLLISDDSKQDIALPSGETKLVERATMANIRNAIMSRWVPKGNTSADNMVIFYFCGHGVSRGGMTSLLAEDFASDDLNPLAEAIDFRNFHAGMDKCKARNQFFFIDACRSTSRALIEEYDHFYGDAIIPPSASYLPVGQRYAQAYYATLAGQSAYGRTGKMTVFTDALIRTLGGFGSEECNGKWEVNSNTIKDGLDVLLHHLLRNSIELEQLVNAETCGRVKFHILEKDPQVILEFGCLPQTRNEDAVLLLKRSDQNKPKERKYREENWVIEVVTGDYEFDASFTDSQYHVNPQKKFIYPPKRECHLEVMP